MQKVTVWSITGLSAAVLLSAAACHRGPGARNGRMGDHDGDHDEHVDERDRDGPDVGSGLKANSAVRAIARARCEREKRCDNIGADKSYLSSSACEEKIRADWSGDLNKYECPQGTSKDALDACMNDIRAEDCGNPFDTLSRLTTCNAADICLGD